MTKSRSNFTRPSSDMQFSYSTNWNVLNWFGIGGSSGSSKYFLSCIYSLYNFLLIVLVKSIGSLIKLS
jgi:hypothetical protein